MPPPPIRVDARFLEEQKAKLDARRERFSTSPDVPPIEPRRRIAWPGGKIVSNKEDALRKFLERRPSKEELAAMISKRRQEDAAHASVSGDDEEEKGQREPSNADAQAAIGGGTEPSAKPMTLLERLRAGKPPPVYKREIDDPEPTPIAPSTRVALTGNFSPSRDALIELIRSHGCDVSPTVNKRVRYVVATDRAVRFKTQLVRKAAARGITVVSEPWLRLGLLLQRQAAQQHGQGRAAASRRVARGAEAGALRRGRHLRQRLMSHYQLARHNPWRMLRYISGWPHQRRHSTVLPSA